MKLIIVFLLQLKNLIKNGVYLIDDLVSRKAILKWTNDFLYPFRNDSYFVEDLPDNLEDLFVDA